MTTRRWPDVMLDLETLSTAPEAVVLSLALVAFDRDSWDVGPAYKVAMTLDDQVDTGAVVSPDTVLWWLQQSEEARADVVAGKRIPTPHALMQISSVFAGHLGDGVRCWAKPNRFDWLILERTYARFGMETPWGFRQEQDVRTALTLVGMDATRVGAGAHIPENDCAAQIYDVQRARFLVTRLLKLAERTGYDAYAGLAGGERPVAEELSTEPSSSVGRISDASLA